MEYRLIRSSRRTMCVQITKDGDIVVRAPYRASQKIVDAFVESQKAWIEAHRDTVLRRLAENPPPSMEQIALWREQAKEIIPPLVQKYAAIMGVKAASVRINTAKTRYGSCSTKHSLNFSCLVMRHPMECVEYVVVHELAHIRHPNHSRAFWEEVEYYMPDYRIRRAQLRKV